ncbi:MAG TPA: XrtA/PEP-CTERM system exopolysaccharide export protein [Povalibacter sp.]|nr:XrtA/PEP-CTERM system exopolysaccharide export protein [Povalibacter sp.]
MKAICDGYTAACAVFRRLAVVWSLPLLAGLGLTVQAAETNPPAAPVNPPAATTNAPAPPTPAQIEESTGSQYIVGPGDTIQVFVWRNPELTVTVPVRPDGKISTPLVEDLVAVGKTPSQLARDIEARLAEYVRSPQVNVIVSNAASAFNQVRVVGQVKTPQSVAYREGMTALDVLLAAGGLTDFAAGNRSKIMRKDEHGKEITIKVRLNDVLTKGDMSSNVPVKPGDLLFIPEAMF